MASSNLCFLKIELGGPVICSDYTIHTVFVIGSGTKDMRTQLHTNKD